MAGTSRLKVNGGKEEGAATAQKLCYGFAAASSRDARGDLRCAFTELLRGVDVCLILDQFDELITCPIHEGDGALRPYRYARQRRNTVMVRVPRSFVDETLWPEFLELSEVLKTYLEEITNRVIAEAIHADGGDEEVIPGEYLGK